MRQSFLTAFGGKIAGCITETNAPLINAFDCYNCDPSEQRSYISTNPAHPIHFTLHNLGHQPLVFVAIDNCILKASDSPRCDFVIGNFQKLFLVEVKWVNTGKRRAARNSAVCQLYETLSLLRNRIDLRQTALVAVVCLKASKSYPLQSARKGNERVRFLEEHGADLMEGQEAYF